MATAKMVLGAIPGVVAVQPLKDYPLVIDVAVTETAVLAAWRREALFIGFGTLVVFVAVMGLAALALSESLRWRFKRYISTHFYADKYDYRQQWRTFTANLTTRVTLDGLAAQLLRSVTQTIGARKAALYLADETDGALRIHSVLNAGPLPKTLEATPDDFLAGQKASEARHVSALANGRAEQLLAASLPE